MAEQDIPNSSYEALLSELRARRECAIQKYDAAIAALEALKTDWYGEVSGNGMPLRDSIEVISISPGEFHGLSYTKAAEAILRKTNRRALTTQEIMSYYERSGKKIDGKNPTATLYSSLKKSKEFELVTRNTWGLAEWYGKSRKSNRSLAEKTIEVLHRGPVSLKDAVQKAEMESKERT